MGETAGGIYFPTKEDNVDLENDLPKMSESVEDRFDGIKGDATIATDGTLTIANHGLLPAGVLLPAALAAAPAGFLLCDGAAVSRTTYKALFEAIGTAYGVGDGSTTFNVPNLTERVPVGKGASMALASIGGEKNHSLSEGEMPSHSHTFSGSTGVDSPDHIHEQQVLADGSGGVGLRKDYDSDGTGTIFQQGVGTAGASARHTHAFSGATTAKGGGSAHNNMQPYQVVNYLIKT